ncbi:MAG: hypothetical protein FWH05_04950 [Oscillospiraceae bacterium]|nr:hypothetical protein [Oscillospiraceae bacterium]
MKICKHCEAENYEHFDYCAECGETLPELEVSEPEEQISFYCTKCGKKLDEPEIEGQEKQFNGFLMGLSIFNILGLIVLLIFINPLLEEIGFYFPLNLVSIVIVIGNAWAIILNLSSKTDTKRFNKFYISSVIISIFSVFSILFWQEIVDLPLILGSVTSTYFIVKTKDTKTRLLLLLTNPIIYYLILAMTVHAHLRYIYW